MSIRGRWANGVALGVALLAGLSLHGQRAAGQDAPAHEPKPPVAAKVRPIPSAEAQKEALTTINQTFNIRRAVTLAQKLELAKKMLAVAGETDDSSSRYALFTQAKSLAVQAGDGKTAMAALEGLSRDYGVAPASSRREIVSRCKFTSEDLTQMIDSTLQANDFATARQLLVAGGNNKEFVQLRKKATEMEAEYGKVKAILESGPDSYTVSRYIAFVQGNWEEGLKRLSKQSDEQVTKALAQSELENPTEAKAQMAVADGWWDLAEKEKGVAKDNLKAHASEWYRKAVAGGLMGLDKARAESRMLEGMGEHVKNLIGKWEVTYKGSKFEWTFLPDGSVRDVRGQGDVRTVKWEAEKDGIHIGANRFLYPINPNGTKVINTQKESFSAVKKQ